MQIYLNETTRKAWPRWAVSPEGKRAIFACPGDIPTGWTLEVPLPGTPSAETDAPELAGLRAAYAVLFGKKPGPGWDAEIIKAKIAEKAAN